MAQQVIIAFDSSSTACSVALLQIDTNGQEKTFSLHEISPMQQGRLILPMAQELLTSAGLTLGDVTTLVYGAGPGSFTGLRLTSSVVQAIGFTRKIPVIAISSMAALAQTVFTENNWPSILVALDARKGNIFFGAYKANESGLMRALQDEALCAPEKILIKGNENWYGVGDGWKNHEEILTRHLLFKPIQVSFAHQPSAIALLQLAKNKINNPDAWVTPSNAIPVYLSPYKS